MGWQNRHLHHFSIGGDLYGPQFDDYPEEELNEADVRLLQAPRDDKPFTYEYDLGDGWEHDIIVGGWTTTPFGLKYAVCVEGQNDCPPEDCGGPPGYALMLEVLADPS